jgi:molybdenum cofactor synthesis domain-containing protein
VQSAAVLIVGDEILSGEIADSNGPYLIRRLSSVGVRVVRQVVAPDEESVIADELARLRALADAVVVAGGIGPTHDDVTRPAVARVLGLPLEPHADAVLRIRALFRGRETPADLGMALWPRGARLLHGARTGTFGFCASGVYVLPGVPALFEDLVESLAGDFAAPPLHRTEILTRRSEGEIAEGLATAQGGAADVRIGSYPVLEDGRWHVRVVVRGRDPARIEQVARGLRPALE